MSRVIRSQKLDEFQSDSRPGTWYAVQVNQDDDGHAYLSCNCRGWTTSPRHKGKQAWQRSCRHTFEAYQAKVLAVVDFLSSCSGKVEWWLEGRIAALPDVILVRKPEQARVKPSGVRTGGRPVDRKPPAKEPSGRFSSLEV